MRHEEDGAVNGALFAADGERVLTWGDDRTLRWWDAATGVQIGEALEHAKALSAVTALAVLAILLVYTTISALRWLVVLRALSCETSLRTTTRITFIGAFFNQFLPTSVGSDVVRVWESYRSGFDLAKTFDSSIGFFWRASRYRRRRVRNFKCSPANKCSPFKQRLLRSCRSSRSLLLQSALLSRSRRLLRSKKS